MEFINQKINKINDEIVKKADDIVTAEQPIILSQMATDLFNEQGAFNGRQQWADNLPSTIKRKGRNSPNIDTGLLENTMETTGFLMQDNWQQEVFAINEGYEKADAMRKFSDLGETEADNEYMVEKLTEALRTNLNIK